jgi:hypothetical protein
MAPGQRHRGKTAMERHIGIQVEDTPSNIPSTTSIHQPTCFLCHQPIGLGSSTVPTTTRDLVHVACADRDALSAAQHRQRQALILGAGMLLIGLLLLWFVHALLGLLLLLILAVFHMRMNNVWWRHAVWRLRRGWRRMQRIW